MFQLLIQKKIVARLITLLAAAFILMTVYGVARQFYWQSEFERVSDRAVFFNSTLVTALERYQHLPFVLARDTFVVEGLEAGGTQLLNLRLETFAKQAQVDALYVMNTDGLTIAASNWRKTPTYLGNNYGFRPYFHSALDGKRGEFFAIGVTTQLPGYFVAEPVHNIEGQIIGVVAMKVDLSPLIDSWAEGGEKLFASNEDGVVVLSSNASWNYQTLKPLSTQTRAHIEKERQFTNKPLSPLDVKFLDQDEMQLGKIKYLHHVSDISHLKWKLHYLADKDVILQKSQRALLLASIIMSLFLAAYLILRSERIKQALRASEADSRSLRALNEDLEREIEDRRRAEKRLARTQKELKQASKLAALGELSASVSHELGQPISAMQNYLAVADLPDNNMDSESRDVMQRLSRLVVRMGQITKQLKFFARPGGDVFTDVDIRDVITGVREMMVGDIHLAQVEMLIDLPDHPIIVRGDKLRLEQVLINLLRNSLDAMKENDGHSLEIKLLKDAGKVYVNVLDRGPGLPEELADQLFESFVTTKASGEGMGLGLAISASIVEDHDGELKARTRDTGGAEFSMIIPAITSSENVDG